MNHYFTVDTGWNTALAYWRKEQDLIPRHTHCIVLPRSIEDREERLVWMWGTFEDYIKSFDYVNGIVLEMSEYWSDSAKSEISHKQGDVHTLTLLIGGYCDIARKLEIPFMLKLAREWKGNMTDDQVKRRVKYVNGIYYSNPHVADAVGMGLSLIGKYNIRKRRIK